MAEIISSAVLQETVSHVLSNMVQKYEQKDESSARRNLERLEMAQIRLEAALEASEKWHITDASLLRWRRKLRRAAQECDDTLHKCRQRVLDDEDAERLARESSSSSFPARVARATRSFIFSAFGNGHPEPSRSTVKRFEWFADGAAEFLRFIELGGAPRVGVPFNPLVRRLLTGHKLQHKMSLGASSHLFMMWMPFVNSDHGIEAGLLFMQKDASAPEDNFFLTIMLQISESTDVVGIVARCLQLFDPLFKSAVERIRSKILQLPTQDLAWVPNVESYQKQRLDSLHSFGTRWCRPNPLCCKRHRDLDLLPETMSHHHDVSLEPVIQVNLQCQVSTPPPRQYSRQRSSSRGSTAATAGSRTMVISPPRLKAGLYFMPHAGSGSGSSPDEDLLPANTSSAAAVIHGGKQHRLRTDVTLQQVQETMLPQAVDYFRRNAEASVYQMLWKSRHGTAYIQVEAAPRAARSPSRQASSSSIRGGGGGNRKRKFLKSEDDQKEKGEGEEDPELVESTTRPIPQFLEMWVPHAPARLQSSISDWVQKTHGDKELAEAAPYNCSSEFNKVAKILAS